MDNDNILLQKAADIYRGLRFKMKYRGVDILPAGAGNDLARELLESGQPFLFGRCGATEMRTVADYLQNGGKNIPDRPREDIRNLSGVFPTDDAMLEKFCRIYVKCAQNAELLALWNVGAEREVIRGCDATRFTELRALEPYYHAKPWSAALAGKRVLVVHPFRKTILAQYARRAQLFPGKNVLPEFASLTVVQAVQGLGGQATGYASWFDAQAAMERMKIDEDMPIESKMLSRSIQQAQTTVESRNFQARKSVLEYDDVMNKQREIIYGQRRQVLEGMDVKDVIMNMMNTSITHLVQNAFSGVHHLDMTSCQELLRQVEGLYFPKYAVRFTQEQLDTMDAQAVIDAFTQAAAAYYQQKEDEFTPPVMREVERVVLLRVVDEYWMEHIDAMSDLRQGIRLRAYAQTDPIIAYKKESLEMFEEMIAAIQDETVRRLYSVRLQKNEEVKRQRVANATSESVGGDGTVKKQPRKVKKIGRNEPCPCGSGKKYKNCCGRNA